MTKVAYFDCFSGCSGDMMLGALLDAGVDFNLLKEGLSGLKIDGYRLMAEKVKKASVTATKFSVVMDEHVEQHHRSLSHILEIINSSRLPDAVKQKSSDIFQRLGEVEATVHGIPVEDVHFHEIGAVDSIIDIVGTVYALELLKIERCYASALPVGSGTVNTAHGILPVPVPATVKLLAEAGAPITDTPKPGVRSGELITPTGAALVTYFAGFKRPEMKVTGIGSGAGNKDFKEWPNVMRVWIGEETEGGQTGDLILLETNIDDMNPQVYGYLMDKLFAEKAVDVWYTPVQMKKNRPGIILSVLVPATIEKSITEIIMKETTTLGIRVRPVARHTAEREIIQFESSLGSVRVKIKRYSGEVLGISAEYEDCRKIAGDRNLPLQEVMRIIEEEAGNKFKK